MMCQVGVNSCSSHPFLVGTAKIIFNSFNDLRLSQELVEKRVDS